MFFGHDDHDQIVRHVYNYIFTVENQRANEMIKKIELLFKDDPLSFDELMVNEHIKRYEKKLEYLRMNKSSDQIYREQKRKARRIKRQFQRIIEKYDIKIDENVQMPNNMKHQMKAMQDMNSFQSYKDRAFFQDETNRQKKR